MSDVQTGDSGGGHGKHEKKRAKKSSTRIDMTPMVDLGFLLLTFFVLTATFSKPTTMEITMPIKDETKPEDVIKVKKVITILLADNERMFYYEGVLNPDGSTPVVETSFDQTKGIRKVLLEKQKKYIDKFREIERDVKKLKGQISDDSIRKLYDHRVNEIHKVKGDDATWTVIIKPDPKASYKNVIDMVDEMSIAQVGKYAIVDISASEKDVLNKLGVK